MTLAVRIRSQASRSHAGKWHLVAAVEGNGYYRLRCRPDGPVEGVARDVTQVDPADRCAKCSRNPYAANPWRRP